MTKTNDVAHRNGRLGSAICSGINRRAFTGLAVLALIGASFAPVAVQAAGLLDKIKQEGTFKVGLAVDPPFALRKADGTWYSFLPDLLDDLSKDMGVKIDIIPTGWTTIVAGLQSEQYDMIGASISATEERKKVIDFTIPYAYGGTTFLVLKDNPKNLNSIEDLNKSDATIAFQTGGAQDTVTHKVTPDATMRALPNISNADLISELSAKRADAISMPSFLTAALLQKFPDFKAIPDDTKGIETTGIAWGINKGNDDLKDYLDSFIQKEIDSGRMKELMEKNLTVENAAG